MALTKYIIKTPEQLEDFERLCMEGAKSVENLRRFWRTQCAIASVNYKNPMPTGLARVEFETKPRAATICKVVGGKTAVIAKLHYNRALALCREKQLAVMGKESEG